MSTAPAQSQQDAIPAPPTASSPLPNLSPREAQSLRGAIGLGLVLTMPILMILPPRRLNGIMALQVGMLGFGANELLAYRTGQGLIWWAGKPYRWARGVDDTEAQDQKLQARLNKRRQMKEEEMKRRTAEEAEEVIRSLTSDANVKSTTPLEFSRLERRSRWVGREG